MVDLTLKIQDNLSSTIENLDKEVRLDLEEVDLVVAGNINDKLLQNNQNWEAILNKWPVFSTGMPWNNGNTKNSWQQQFRQKSFLGGIGVRVELGSLEAIHRLKKKNRAIVKFCSYAREIQNRQALKFLHTENLVEMKEITGA